MSAIAIDLGEKKVGIALEINKIAIPKKIVSRINLIRELKKIFQENSNYEKIIVGLPYDLYNNDKKQLNKTLKYMEKLKKIFPKKEVIGVDERFSTFEAKTIGKMKSNKKEIIDDISASIILETYLNSCQ